MTKKTTDRLNYVTRLCPMCGQGLPWPKPTGRRAVYCSPACRKAAYDARRARTPGAFDVKVVTHEHGLQECARRVSTSPDAVADVFRQLTTPEALSKLKESLLWQQAVAAMQEFLEADIDRARQPTRRRRRR
ncbi:hypothetical protein [Nocardioides sp. NPDC047086]|uniref:hypothetical protein n=1 Tax=Nocardioides sp. NPDC047086 TaxID=3154810 RepID=UPI003402888A